MKPLRLKNMIAGCLLAAGALPVWGQSGAPTLVIRIDDLGALHSVNEACIQTYRSGIARSVEVMPRSSLVSGSHQDAERKSGTGRRPAPRHHQRVGERGSGVPLTHCPSLTDENGYFYPMMFPNPAYPGQSIMEQEMGHQGDRAGVPRTDRDDAENAFRNSAICPDTCSPPVSAKK